MRRKNDKTNGTKLPYKPRLGEQADVTADAEDSPVSIKKKERKKIDIENSSRNKNEYQ